MLFGIISFFMFLFAIGGFIADHCDGFIQWFGDHVVNALERFFIWYDKYQRNKRRRQRRDNMQRCR